MAHTPTTPKHVVIVGGGLIGLSAAHALLRDGHAITIIERDHLGAGAATGNAGELTPQQVAPLASRNTALDVTRGVFTKSSYLSISPFKLPQLARFGIEFLLASTKKRAARGEAALAQFLTGMFPALDRLTADGIDTSGGGEGYLMTCSDEAALQAAYHKHQLRADKGWGEAPGPILRGDALHEAEPALGPEVRSGFMLPAERSLDPVLFVASQIKYLLDAGVEVRTGLTAKRLGQGTSVVCVDAQGNEETVTGDAVIVAAGAWTTPLLRRSGIRSKQVVTGKGYSFTVPIERMPKTLIHAIDVNSVIIPMNGRLRIVGMMEFDEQPEKFNAHRLDVLTRAASRVLTGADWSNRTDEWVGPRPMTSDGLPLLGEVAGHPNVFVASGHNMHGLSLGPLTGEILADLVAGRAPTSAGKPIDLKPFAVNR